jgi:hypothetical protein
MSHPLEVTGKTEPRSTAEGAITSAYGA